ncbi:hypothetical protein CK203_100221 [Vitis vinifera]|uniref:Uncharacterized protein n=1 Tax=Vitis vinifera TaxID=29760 RepID=A0A438CRC7_VITVI|nr:hypothetical protein CK203_100221 [Vitis vinifera]
MESVGATTRGRDTYGTRGGISGTRDAVEKRNEGGSSFGEGTQAIFGARKSQIQVNLRSSEGASKSIQFEV